MKKSMDLFGEALFDYSNGDRGNFFLEDSKGNKHRHSLDRYFRDSNKFTKLEKKLISEARGKILDLGCGTGNYTRYLGERKAVLGIDISPNVIKVARKKYNLKNVEIANIFNFKTKKRFDTIILLENNLGMAGTLKRTRKLLKILSNLLAKDGQILINATNVPNGTYLEVELKPIWKKRKGQGFKWISFNAEYLKRLCRELGLDFEILGRDRYHYLARISKDNAKLL